MTEIQRGFVETVYGRMPGCPVCGVIPITAPHICEHGVTPAPRFDLTLMLTYPVNPDSTREEG